MHARGTLRLVLKTKTKTVVELFSGGDVKIKSWIKYTKSVDDDDVDSA